MTVAALVLAAGAATRMGGRDKLLEAVDGTPQLARAVAAARDGGAAPLVVLGAHATSRREAVPLGVPVVRAEAWEAGMGASIAAGVAALIDEEGVLVLPGDMPEIDAALVRAVLSRLDPQRPVRPMTPEGVPGHPVLFPRALFGALRGLRDDAGARPVLRDHPPITFAAGQGAALDLDTPEAWAAWRAGR